MISTEGFDSSVFFILFQQEGGVIDIYPLDTVKQQATDKDMVDTPPLALIAISCLCPMRTCSITGNIPERMTFQET